MKKQVLTLITLCALAGCKPDNTPNGDKPQTHSYMEATINGETWKACRIAGAVGQIHLTATYYQNDGYLQLQTIDYCKTYDKTSSTLFYFKINNAFDTGTYVLRTNNIGLWERNSVNSYKTDENNVGWFELKEIDTNKRYISGKFEFLGYCESNDSIISVTNGKFNRIPY